MKTLKPVIVLFLLTFLCSFPLLPTQGQSLPRETENSRKQRLLASLLPGQETTQTPGDNASQQSEPQQGFLNQQPQAGFPQPVASNSQPFSNGQQSDPQQGLLNLQPQADSTQPFASSNQPIAGNGQPFSTTNLPFLKNSQGGNIPFLNEASQEKRLTLLVVWVSLLASMSALG